MTDPPVGSPTGTERRRLPRNPGAGVIGYARFRTSPGIHQRYPGHDVGRWYPILERNDEAVQPMPEADFVWLDMGSIRGVAKADLDMRPPERG
jgi:hypothetical protein